MTVSELRKLLGSKLEDALGDYGFVRPSKKSHKLTLDGDDLHTEVRWFADHEKSFTELARVSINYSLRSEILFDFAAKTYEPTSILFDAYSERDFLFHSQVQHFFDSERWPNLDFQKRDGLPKLIDDYVEKFSDTFAKHDLTSIQTIANYSSRDFFKTGNKATGRGSLMMDFAAHLYAKNFNTAVAFIERDYFVRRQKVELQELVERRRSGQL